MIARRLCCRVLGLTLPTAGLPNTLRPVLAGVVGCVLPTCAQGLVVPNSRWLGEEENKWSSSWGLALLLLILVSVLLFSTWIHTRRGHRYSGQRHRARRCTSLLVVVPVGSGHGVGDCHDAANFLEKWLFISLVFHFWEKTLSFFSG